MRRCDMNPPRPIDRTGESSPHRRRVGNPCWSLTQTYGPRHVEVQCGPEFTPPATPPRRCRCRWSRPGARCRHCCWSVSPGPSPNPPCGFHRNGLSMVSAVGWFRQPGPRVGNRSSNGGGQDQPRPNGEAWPASPIPAATDPPARRPLHPGGPSRLCQGRLPPGSGTSRTPGCPQLRGPAATEPRCRSLTSTQSTSASRRTGEVTQVQRATRSLNPWEARRHTGRSESSRSGFRRQ